ncbi:MAG TPA: hypothetical protein VN493_04620 [Thermoanaerobaculia bacterium]|nr:hypothetical protein [Thermoanaerobaculia bacterium]
MTPEEPIGRWRVVPEHRESFGDSSILFTRFGDLVYSTLGPEGVTGRFLLVYEVEGDEIVTDQPSEPAVERTPFRIEDGRLYLGDCAHHREGEEEISDPFARMFAIGSAAIEHGLGSVSPDGPFISFLMVDAGEQRSLRRIVTDTLDEARDAARQFVEEELKSVEVCAYAFDGYVTLQEGKFDAILVEVSDAAEPDGLILAQPYALEGGQALRQTALEVQLNPSWLGRPA